MNERAPLPRVVTRPEPGPVLLVVPHADDDVIGCGGTAALHADAGDDVHVLVVFNGLAGDADRTRTPEEYIALRRGEARAAGAHLGIRNYTFWDYPEGHEPADEEIVVVSRRFAAFVHELAPRTIYAPWIGEYHLDHHVLARLVRMGLALTGFGGQAWGYEVWTPLIPTLIVDVSSVHQRKVAALEEHKSQFEYQDMLHKTLALSAQRAIYCARDARHGEGFAPLGPPAAHDAALVEAARREDEAARG